MARPDYSDYVVHLTKSADPFGLSRHEDDDRLRAIAGNSAYDRLVAILQDRAVRATPMPWTDSLAVAFSECPWGTLVHHAERYSPYGIGFHKARLFAAGGGPALYLRQDFLQWQRDYAHSIGGAAAAPFQAAVWSFVTPFAPFYAPQAHLARFAPSGPVDYAHEREWRVPHDFSFDYRNVEFVIVDNYEDMARFPRELKDAIGRDRFLIMDVYRQVERLWPVHLV